MKRLQILFILLSTGAFAQVKTLQRPSAPDAVFLNSSSGQQWRMQRVDKVPGGGSIISSANFKAEEWLPAIVPGTVLNSLVANNLYPDPYIGDINRRERKVIPDIADIGKEFYHYWFRTSFRIPATVKGKRIWLKLHGINYRSEIWLNGTKLGEMAGMFNAQAFDITDYANRRGSNILAVNITPVDVPGQSNYKNKQRTGAIGENRNGGDGEIGKNVTMLMSVGWDFTVPDGVRDRNTGIWRDVEIYSTDDVVLEDPFVYSKLPLPDTTTSTQTISVEVRNVTDKPQAGLVKGTIKGTKLTFQQKVTLAPQETKTITFDKVVIKNPKLWWPINKGAQNLYTLDLAFLLGTKPSHSVSTRFGVREVSSDQQTPDKSRRFLVNGYPVFIRGTNWVPEAMLRNSVTRTNAELEYTHQAGLNLIRFWGGGIAESDFFFDRCDELGILLWNEYWMTGDTRFPADKALYLANIASTVKRIRNHASLAYHVSSNESTEVPGAADLIKTLDPSRGYQMQSECCGVHDGSPYKYENAMQYFENTASQRGSRVDGFNPEYGTPCLPTVESLREMMPAKDLWPIVDSVWNYLDGGGFHQITTKYRQAVNEFGESSSIEEFAKKAQFVGALNYRAIWEVWNYNKFGFGDRWASGFLFWYHNSPVRQTGGRMYDWSLEPTAALYYSQNGLQPLHAQYDYLKNTVSVYNDYRKAFPGYKVIATIYNLQSTIVAAKEQKVDIPADGTVKDAITLSFPDNITPVHFIKLQLQDASGKEVSSSFYWRSTDAYKGKWTISGPSTGGFQQINDLPKTNLRTSAKLSGNVLEVTVANTAKSLAFFTQLKLQDAQGQSIRPSFYSDNFFSLLPGETKTLTIRFPKEDVPGKVLRLVTDGFNVVPETKEFKLP